MAVNTHVGMNTYDRMIQSLRADGAPIGPKFHLHDKHLRKWVAKQNNKAQLAEAREIKKVKGGLRKAKQEMASVRERMAAKIQEINSDAGLREKHTKEAQQKLAAGYKTPEWDTTTGKIKSVGNGL